MVTPYFMEFDQQASTFARKEFTPPALKPQQILIRVTCCTICGSDLHTFAGRRAAPPQCVLGHEIIGEVASWGEGATPRDYAGNELQIGQRVTWNMAVGCGSCFYCTNGIPQKCESLFKYGHEPGGDSPTGGLSSFCVLAPGTSVFAVPDSLSDEIAAPANCATATVSAALRLISQTHSMLGANVLVVGAGMLGLTAAAQLKARGACKILAADVNRQRLQLALEFGANEVNDSTSDTDWVRRHTENRGVDIALDFAGVLPAVEACIASVRTGGCVLLAGSVFPMEELKISPESVVRRLLTIRGLHNYAPEDLANAIAFLAENQERFPFHKLASQAYPLSQTQAAFEFAANSGAVRVAVKPDRVENLQ